MGKNVNQSSQLITSETEKNTTHNSRPSTHNQIKTPPMKTTITLLLIIISSLQILSAQDVIKRKDGTEMLTKVIGQTATEIEYKLFYYQDGAAAKMQKKDIISIQYQNGTTESFDANAASNATTSTNSYAGNTNVSSDLNQNLDKLSIKIEELTKSGQKQSKEEIQLLTESLKGLKDAIATLNNTIEQGNQKNAEQNKEIVNKLNSVNTSLTDLKDANETKDKDVIVPKKAGMGIHYVFGGIQLLPGIGSDLFGKDGNPAQMLMGSAVSFSFSGGLTKKRGFRFEGDFAYLSGIAEPDRDYPTNLLLVDLKLLGALHLTRVNIFVGPSLTILGGQLFGERGGGVGAGLHFNGEYMVSSHFAITTSAGFNVLGFFLPGSASSSSNDIPTQTIGTFLGHGSIGVKYSF